MPHPRRLRPERDARSAGSRRPGPRRPSRSRGPVPAPSRPLGRRRAAHPQVRALAPHAATPETRCLVLAAVDHELRTPLTTVIGYVEVLLDGEAGRLTEDQARMLQRIDVSASRLLALVTALLGGCSEGLREGEVVDLAGAVVEALGGMDALFARIPETTGVA